MPLTKLRFAFCFLTFADVVFASSVFVLPGSPTPVTLQSLGGAFLISGSQLRVGFFLNLDFLAAGCDSAAAGINASFVPLGEATSPAGLGTPADKTLTINFTTYSVQGGVNNITYGNGLPNTITPGSLSRGTRLFLVVVPADGIGEPGVFSATNWLVPSTDINAVLRLTDIDSPSEVFRGQLGSNTLIMPVICPEPGAAVLAVTGAAGLIVRRRRVRSGRLAAGGQLSTGLVLTAK